MAVWIQHTIEIETATPVRIWTGQGDLTLNSEDYVGMGDALTVSELELSSGEPDRRLQIVLSGIKTTRRSQFIQDLGPLVTTVQWLRSEDYGQTWVVTSTFTGRLSRPVIQDGQIVVELETERGDVDRGKVVRWSHEDQGLRFTGDKGLEYMRVLAQQGIDTTWPP